jgi:hypothetical protein
MQLIINGNLETKENTIREKDESKLRRKKEFWAVSKNFAEDVRILG